MIKLALEVPTAHLEEFEKFQDYNYLIEPWIREDTLRLNYFNSLKKEVYLDNGVNEYGTPSKYDQLLIVAGWVDAKAVIVPDPPGMPEVHLHCLELIKREPFQSIGVLCDSYRWYWREIIQLADIVAIPYDVNETRKELFNIIPTDKPIHFLGFRSLSELYHLVDRIDSIDTGIPIRIALDGVKIEDYTLRHTDRRAHVTPKDYYNLQLKEDQLELATRNAAVLRMVCSGSTIQRAIEDTDRTTT